MSAFPETLSRDQGRLRRLQAACRRNPADAEAEAALAAALADSRSAFTARAAARPDARIDDSLPVGRYADELRELISRHQVVVVAGETGSGKTTQLPKICQIGRASCRERV